VLLIDDMLLIEPTGHTGVDAHWMENGTHAGFFSIWSWWMANSVRFADLSICIPKIMLTHRLCWPVLTLTVYLNTY